MIFSEKLAEQYQALKKEEPGLVLLMQVGAFLQVMNEDARCLAEVTGLKLKMAGNPDEPFVVGGFPVSGLDLYGQASPGGSLGGHCSAGRGEEAASERTD